MNREGPFHFAQWCEDGDVASDVGSAVSAYGVWANSEEFRGQLRTDAFILVFEKYIRMIPRLREDSPFPI